MGESVLVPTGYRDVWSSGVAIGVTYVEGKMQLRAAVGHYAKDWKWIPGAITLIVPFLIL